MPVFGSDVLVLSVGTAVDGNAHKNESLRIDVRWIHNQKEYCNSQ